MFEYIKIFLKGILMGVADLVPGVSGGTIAFITGIYDRYINGLKDLGTFIKLFLLKLFGKTPKKKYSTIFKKIDFKLFVPLFLGILLAVFLGASIMSNLIENFPSIIYSFFVGLILASVVIVHKKIKTKNVIGLLFGLLGLIIGLIITFIPGLVGISSPSLLYVLIVGFISISVMLLPGISGAYIVLIFGLLEFMYDSIKNLDWQYLLAFGIGAIIGFLTTSRLIAHLLKNYRSNTLYLLIGLMIGALYKPVSVAISNTNGYLGIAYALIAAIIGFVVVIIIEKINK